jgi:putative transposase
VRSYKYRIYPRKKEIGFLNNILADSCFLYNSALQHRIEAYRKGKNIKYVNQSSELKDIRREIDSFSQWSFSAQQQVLRKLDKAFKSFFNRVKRGEKPGFPRFKSPRRYKSISFVYGDGASIKGHNLHLTGCPGKIKIKLHRKFEGTPKQIVVTRDNGKWYICVQTDYEERKEPRTEITNPVGIDLGLTNLISCSDGFQVKTPQWYKNTQNKLRILNRSLARKKKLGYNFNKVVKRLQATYKKMVNQRKDFIYKTVNKLIRRYDYFVLEDLSTKKLCRGIFSKSFHNASWATFVSILEYKAANAGIQVEKVDAKYTSQTCPKCGTIKKKSLSERIHKCKCGYVEDRDIVAAQCILLKSTLSARTGLLEHKVEPKFMLAPRSCLL